MAQQSPNPTVDAQLEDFPAKYAQCRVAASRVITAMRVPRVCGFAFIMALMDLAWEVAETDGLDPEALKRVLGLWYAEGETLPLPSPDTLREAFGPVTQPTEAIQEKVQAKRDAVWLGNVVSVGRA